MLRMTADDLNRFLDDAFGADRTYVVDDVDESRLLARVRAGAVRLRPGGTISGPTLMGLADGAAYCQILAHSARDQNERQIELRVAQHL